MKFKHTFSQEDILDWPKVEALIDKAGRKGIKSKRNQCLVALAWVFGKRIHEILRLKREDFDIGEQYLYVTFRVGKKRKKNTPVERTWTKKIALSHPAVKYVLAHVQPIQKGYIFASNRVESEKYWRTVNNQGEVVEYFYPRPGGYLSLTQASRIIKSLDERLYWHFFRYSLATQMARKQVPVAAMVKWFDWESANMAMKYVQENEEITEQLSNREF